MKNSKLWLTVLINEEDNPRWPPGNATMGIDFNNSETIQECNFSSSFRTSPIFPLSKDYNFPNKLDTTLVFYCFEAAYPLLGEILRSGSEELINNIWYSIGLASIIIISPNNKHAKEFEKIVKKKPVAKEVWIIKNEIIIDIKCEFSIKPPKFKFFTVIEYSVLPAHIRVIIDEFVASINIILQKSIIHTPSETVTFTMQIDRVNDLISELIFVHNPDAPIPKSLTLYKSELIKNNEGLKETIIHQNVDRLIQINSALSYVSTQALSGATPILERRSLIRRHSLLGIGTSILALNRFTKSIEKAFARNSIENVIVNKMTQASILPGLDLLPKEYDKTKWQEFSVNHFQREGNESRKWYPKLPYFSGRLSFRETEYTISAAFQSITNGATLQWSLMTLTHEILHGHVRNILSYVFKGNDDDTPEKKRQDVYDQFIAMLKKETVNNFTELDSIRFVILYYCSLSYKLGSLTRTPHYEVDKSDDQAKVFTQHTLNKKELLREFEIEYRNISEIFVHVLDLNYFYGNRITAYIPLIWRSWAETPQVKGDIRQYILRSLLVISTKCSGKPKQRLDQSIKLFEEILEKNEVFNNVPIIKEVLASIKNEVFIKKISYPFLVSLIIVDLVENIFVSEQIRIDLLGDPLVRMIDEEDGIENKLEYKLPQDFSPEVVRKPNAYLLDRVVKLLDGEVVINVEAETAKFFLACCSYTDQEV